MLPFPGLVSLGSKSRVTSGRNGTVSFVEVLARSLAYSWWGKPRAGWSRERLEGIFIAAVQHVHPVQPVHAFGSTTRHQLALLDPSPCGSGSSQPPGRCESREVGDCVRRLLDRPISSGPISENQSSSAENIIGEMREAG